MAARGVVFIHAAAAALCPHVEWALSGVLGEQVSLDWTEQPVAPGAWRAELSWVAAPGTGALLASALTGWTHLRFEVTEEPSAGCDGARFAYTPTLGLFHAVTGAAGDLWVGEDRLRAALARADGDVEALATDLRRALGGPWDDELEAFRWAGEGAPVRWLHRVV